MQCDVFSGYVQPETAIKRPFGKDRLTAANPRRIAVRVPGFDGNWVRRIQSPILNDHFWTVASTPPSLATFDLQPMLS
jgi:hypothetical protein